MVNPETLDVVFADMVQAEVSDECVILNVIQVLPPQEGGTPTGRVASRIVVTWPHFVRLSAMCTRIIESNGSKASRPFEAAVAKDS